MISSQEMCLRATMMVALVEAIDEETGKRKKFWIPVVAVLRQLARIVDNNDVRWSLEAGSQDSEGVVPPLALANDMKSIAAAVWTHKGEQPSCTAWCLECRME